MTSWQTLEADAVGRSAGLGVGVQVLEILRHGEVEQGHPVVKHRRCAGDLPGVVVPQDAEVAEVPVLIVDHSIEHQHTPDLLIGFRSKLPVILQAGFQPPSRTIRPMGI